MSSTQQPSNLFPLLFAGLGEDNPVSVLDVGLATPETVEFFSSYRCRLQFAGLFSDPVVTELQHNALEAELLDQFVKLLDFPTGTRFDICLFWDFLNYLRAPALHAFSEALLPFLHTDTLAHGFGLLNRQTELKNQSYGIARLDTLMVRTNSAKQMPYFPHPQARLNVLLPGFSVSRSLLLAGGQLELLLHTRAAQESRSRKSGRNAGPGSLSA